MSNLALAKMRIVKMFTQTLDMEVRKRDKETVSSCLFEEQVW